MVNCWIIVEKGLKGTENQCLALAEAAGFSTTVKTIGLKQPWKSFAPWFTHFSPKALTPESAELNAPWPDVIIAAGRKAIVPALWAKKQSDNKAKLVILLSPVIKNKNFDLVITPKHDQYKGYNVLEMTGALSLITPAKLSTAKEEWRGTLEKLPSPRIAVLIGGTSRTHTMTEAVTDRLIAQLKTLSDQGKGLMITASRRTPEAFVTKMRQVLNGPTIHFWDGVGANPYQGYLAWADAIIVSEDSVSMGVEAVGTGKPVYIVKMEGGSKRFNRFHNNLIKNNYARWFEGSIESWPYTPPDDIGIAVKRVKQLLDA